ncbi:MAG: SsrA-binding protein SmpB [Chlorobi bacterium]|nr:SsrA-binding protein SmpB [Chlorobiota bacterium]
MAKKNKQSPFKNHIDIRNKKARFDYDILEKYEAGIQLTGTEIKAIRMGKASIAESYCEFNDRGELFVTNMYIKEYDYGTHYNHNPKRQRKLLLHKKQLRKLRQMAATKGITIIPLRLYINKKGLAKMEIAVARGRKKYDKRQVLRERDIARELDRERKKYI